MRNKTFRALCGSLTFAFACILFGPYEFAGMSAAVAVALLAGVSMEPLFATLAVGLYLVAGIWLPIYPGGGSGIAVLFGSRGGFLLSLVLCALVISALVKGLRGHPFLSVFVGLCASFMLYFGVGILWYVVKTDSSFIAVLSAGWATQCLLFAADALLALVASGSLYKAVR